jgi:hypothetical protein
MFRTVMEIVMLVGSFALPVIFWIGVRKAYSPKAVYLRNEAKWPSSQYGGYSPEAAEAYAKDPQRVRMKRFAAAWLILCLGAGAVAYMLVAAHGNAGVAILVAMGTTYITSCLVGLTFAAWVRRRPRNS